MHALTPPPSGSPFPAALKGALQETDPAAAAALTYRQVEERKKKAAMAAAEVHYEALQALIMEQLGIKEGDIVEPTAAEPATAAPAAGSGVAFGRGGVEKAVAPASKKVVPPLPAARGKK